MQKSYKICRGEMNGPFTEITNDKVPIEFQVIAPHSGSCTARLLDYPSLKPIAELGTLDDCMNTKKPGPWMVNLNDASGKKVLQVIWEANNKNKPEHYETCSNLDIVGGGHHNSARGQQSQRQQQRGDNAMSSSSPPRGNPRNKQRDDNAMSSSSPPRGNPRNKRANNQVALSQNIQEAAVTDVDTQADNVAETTSANPQPRDNRNRNRKGKNPKSKPVAALDQDIVTPETAENPPHKPRKGSKKSNKKPDAEDPTASLVLEKRNNHEECSEPAWECKGNMFAQCSNGKFVWRQCPARTHCEYTDTAIECTPDDQ